MPALDTLKRFFGLSRLEPAPTRRQWFSSLENIARLREVLSDPALIAATNLLIAERLPNAKSPVTDVTAIALRHAFLAGYCEFMDDLHRLATVQTPMVSTVPEEWSHIRAEHRQ